MRCTPHGKTNCQETRCRRERESRTSSTYDAMSDPTSPLHQTVYGGTYYGSGSSSDSGSSICDSGSSSYDSGSSSCDSGGSY